MPLSDMGRPVLRLVWRLKLGIPLGSRGERRTAPLHRQLIVGQTPRPSTNYRLGLQTWKFTSPLGSLFLLTISAGYGLRMYTMIGDHQILTGSNFQGEQRILHYISLGC